jgi:hypothetical protein
MKGSIVHKFFRVSEPPPPTPSVVHPAYDGLSDLGGVTDPGLSPMGGFLFLVLGFCSVFFVMVRRRRHHKVKNKVSARGVVCPTDLLESGRFFS